MKIVRHGTDLERFFRSVSSASERVLMLDYDGTLAPFTEERDRAFPYPGVVQRLNMLVASKQTRTVLVSGRAISDLIPLLGTDQLPEIWGSHGWEHRLPDGTYRLHPLSARAGEGIVRATEAARADADSRALEQKPVAVALHWRGEVTVPGSTIDTWKRIAVEHELDVHAFDGGIELRPSGRTKADAVAETIEHVSADAAIAYLGDDITDEDAFNGLGDRGLKVLVRNGERPTKADLIITPPGEVLDFLDSWIDRTRTR